jgi:hypothetical protein
VMIERGGPFIEPAGVPGIAKSKAVDVEMVAELVAEGAQKGSKRGDLLANGRSHPDPDEHCRGMVVPKKLGRGALPDAQGSGGQHPDAAGPDLVKVGGRGEKLRGRAANVREGFRLHGRLDGPGNSRKSPIFWQRKCFQSITADKEFAISLAWWRVGQHPEFYFALNQRFALGVILARRLGSRCAGAKSMAFAAAGKPLNWCGNLPSCFWTFFSSRLMAARMLRNPPAVVYRRAGIGFDGNASKNFESCSGSGKDLDAVTWRCASSQGRRADGVVLPIHDLGHRFWRLLPYVDNPGVGRFAREE